jgi:small neutral amino acid transporter SnatA (MarC family)
MRVRQAVLVALAGVLLVVSAVLGFLNIALQSFFVVAGLAVLGLGLAGIVEKLFGLLRRRSR